MIEKDVNVLMCFHCLLLNLLLLELLNQIDDFYQIKNFFFY